MNCGCPFASYGVSTKHRVLVDYQGQRSTMLIGDGLFQKIKRLTEETKQKSVKTRIVHGQTLTIEQQRKKQYVDHRNKILGLH